jgi:hypothetical protein
MARRLGREIRDVIRLERARQAEDAVGGIAAAVQEDHGEPRVGRRGSVPEDRLTGMRIVYRRHRSARLPK